MCRQEREAWCSYRGSTARWGRDAGWREMVWELKVNEGRVG